jgi:CRP-like cAMP-binding protein
MSAPLSLEQILHFLLETPLFEDLDEHELSEVVHIMQVQGLRQGQSVFVENQDGDAWYVLYEGHCVVTKESSFTGPREIARLEPRACFGEMAILDGSPRSATVVAGSDVVVFRFPRDHFLSLLDTQTLAAYKLIHQMAKLLCQRQRMINQRLSDALADEGAGEHGVIRRNIGKLLDSFSVSE